MNKTDEKYIELYPSDWLYNAGVVGFLNVVEMIQHEVTDDFIKKGKFEINLIKKILSKKNEFDLSPKILENLPQWHWAYLYLTYLKYYGNFEMIVRNNFLRAENSTQRSQLLKKIIEKDKKFKKHNFTISGKEIDFSKSYEIVSNIWKNTFKKNPKYTISDAIDNTIIELNPYINAIEYRKTIAFLFSTGCFYQNLFNPGWFGDADKFITLFSHENIFKLSESSNKNRCSFCKESKHEVFPIDLKNSAFLFPSFNNFPNSFWSCSNTHIYNICGFCNFLLIHQHLGFIKTQDNTELFINAPNFKLMYHLNKFLNSSISGSNKVEHKNKRALLAMSVIEYASKTNSLLGQWSGMNIEIISRKDKEIEFFSLPYETVQLISNKQISGLLSNIGEFKILNIVLDSRFKQLVDLGYQLLRIALKPNINSGDWKYVNSILFLQGNRNSSFAIKQIARKILKLYALIETRMNKLKY